MSLAFQPTVNHVETLQDEQRELSEKISIIRELEQCPTLVRHFSQQADAILVAMGTRNWAGDAKDLQEWALRKRAEIGIYEHFYNMLKDKEAYLRKLEQVNHMIQQQTPNQE